VLDKLEFFLAVAREGSFSRAAERCGVTQPTLSAAIKQLEEQLGVLLVNRSSRMHGLTPEGERALEWAKRIVADARAMREDLRPAKSGLSGHMRLAVIPTAVAMVAALTTPFRAKHPGVRFSIRSCASQEILALLDGLEADAGITYLDNEPLGATRAVPLYDEQYRLLIARGSQLGERESVRWAELGGLPLCLLTPDMQNRRILDRLLAQAGPAPVPMLESNSVIVLFAHVKSGGFASIVPEKLAEMLDVRAPLRAIPIIEPQAIHKIGLVVPKREPMTPLTAAIVAEATLLAKGNVG